MKNALRLLPWIALVLLSACSSVDVHTDYDQSVNFAGYSTYFWKHVPETDNPLMANRIVNNVDGQLQAKGWRKVPEDQAQTALAAHVVTEKDQRVETYSSGWGWGPGWYGWGMGGMGMGAPMMSTSDIVTYTVGTLIVDLYDVKSQRAIWHGTASETISDDPEDNREKIDEGLRKMFAGFPPGSQQAH